MSNLFKKTQSLSDNIEKYGETIVKKIKKIESLILVNAEAGNRNYGFYERNYDGRLIKEYFKEKGFECSYTESGTLGIDGCHNECFIIISW